MGECGSFKVGIGGGPGLAKGLRERLNASGHDISVHAFGTAESLIRSLAEGRVDGAVRGTLGSQEVLLRVRKEFGLGSIMRTSLMEDMSGRPFMLTPVGIDEGRDMSSKLELVQSTISYFKGSGWRLKVGVLSKGRTEDSGRGPDIEASLKEGDRITRILTRRGISAKHFTILLEDAIEGSDIVLAPDGVSGNLIFRSLHLVAGARSYGAPVLNSPRVFVDTSRARSDFLGPVLLTAGIIGLKNLSRKKH
jgi:putative methanogen marker protein 4